MTDYRNYIYRLAEGISGQDLYDEEITEEDRQGLLRLGIQEFDRIVGLERFPHETDADYHERQWRHVAQRVNWRAYDA